MRTLDFMRNEMIILSLMGKNETAVNLLNTLNMDKTSIRNAILRLERRKFIIFNRSQIPYTWNITDNGKKALELINYITNEDFKEVLRK